MMLRMRRVRALPVAVLAFCVALGTVAWFSATGSRTNAFARGEVAPVVNEEFDAPYTVKRNVSVSANAESVDVYVRATANAVWTAADGAVLWDEPEAGVDYVVDVGDEVYGMDTFAAHAAAGCWVKGDDGFYYYTVPLAAGAATQNLLDEVSVVEPSRYADGRALTVDVAAQAVQAGSHPVEAFDDAWGVAAGLRVGAAGVLEAR